MSNGPIFKIFLPSRDVHTSTMWPTRKLLCFVWFIVSWIRLPRKVVCRRLEKGVHYVYVLRKNREVRFEKQTCYNGCKDQISHFHSTSNWKTSSSSARCFIYVRNYEKRGIWNGNLSNFLLILNSKWSFAAVPMQNNSFWSVLLEFAVEGVIFFFSLAKTNLRIFMSRLQIVCKIFLP